MNSFATTLKILRKQKKISMRALAREADINFTYISKMEKQRIAPPSEDVIRRLAQVLDTDAEQLLWEAGRIPEKIQTAIVADPLAMNFLQNMNHLSEGQRKKIQQILDEVAQKDE